MPVAGWKKLNSAQKASIEAHYATHRTSQKGVLDMPALATKLGCSVVTIGRHAKRMKLTNRYRVPKNKIAKRWVVDAKTGCWLWLLAKTAAGYGFEMGPDGPRYLHRKHYEEKYGAIPAGLVIDHLCRVRHCCNPEHLEAVTDAVNLRRGLTLKLDAVKVRDIRERFKTGKESTLKLSKKYGVNRNHIRSIVKERSWKGI